MKAGQPTDIGHEYKLMINERYEDLARNPVPTGWDVIDEITQGGFGVGELVIFASGPGGGKSWSLVNAAAAAVKMGKTVVYYTLELSEAMIGQRFDAVFTGISIPNLKYNREELEKTISSLKGDLVIKDFPSGTAGINALKAHIDRLVLQGKKPDIIVVDYADLLRGSVKEKRYEVLEELVVDLRGMAGEYGVPLYTASQINRCHNVNDMVETPTGLVKIGNIKIGDTILTHDGYKPVTNVFPIEKQPTYRIKLKDGREINVSAEHMLPTQYNKIKSISSGLKVGDKLFVKKSSKK
jgi:hypothetical protein